MKNDLALEFEAKKRDIMILLKQIASLGFDTTLFQQEFSNIEKKYLNYKESDDVLTLKNIEAHYIEGSVELEEFKHKIKKVFQDYLEIAKNCKSLSYQMERPSELEKVIPLVIDTMEKIQTSSTVSYESEKDIVEEVYNQAYQIIKKELEKNGTSKVLDYVKGNSVARSFVNFKVCQEMEQLKEEEKKIVDSYFLQMTNGEIDYLKEDFLLLLVNITNPSYKTELLYKMNQLQEDYEQYRRQVRETYREIGVTQEKLNTKKQRKLTIFKRACVLLTTAAFSLTAGIAGSAALSKEYKTTIEVFDSRTGQTEETSKYINQLAIPYSQYYLYSNVYYEDGKGYYRDIWTYDLKDGIDPEDIDFSASCIELFDHEIASDKETVMVELSQKDEMPYVRIKKVTKDLEDSQNDVYYQLALLAIFLCIIALIDLFLSDKDKGLILDNIADLLRDLHVLKSLKGSNKKKLLQSLKKLNILLKENEEFRIRYESLFYQYSTLVENKANKVDFSVKEYQLDTLELPKRLVLEIEKDSLKSESK